MKKNILITGGAGYVGSPLVHLFLINNYNVIVVDNLMFGGESLLGVWSDPSFKFIKADITSSDSLKEVFANDKIDAVIHLAAIVGDPACKKQPELARKVNWDAAVTLLELSIKNKVERFIFASTCSNYGKMPDPNGYVDENSTLSPVSLYAELKVKFENSLLNEIQKRSEFCPTSLRFATVYGISPRMRFDLTVNEFIKEMALGRELEVFGEQFWRPYCHVYDFSRAMFTVINSDKEKVAYKTFNVGDTKENYQKQMIINEILKVIPNGVVKYVHKDEDPRDYRVSFEKIKKELGFSILKTVPDGIREIKYLIDNKVFLNPDDQKYRNS
ncbi:nucleoside-diphosphate-sugar epimerase [Candidatus Magnetoovum chiemensis]|nr:nucleoside-diphosphate-sugar epimerase [Candidatus Magnetoovum chiemensis]